MEKTNWNAYYTGDHGGIGLTPRVNTFHLNRIFSSIQKSLNRRLNIIELGGANSCFYDAIESKFQPQSYTVLDNNELGLKKFIQRTKGKNGVEALSADVLSYRSSKLYDTAFSVGLIEHFSPEETKKAIETHWELIRPGGYMILFFPTPTFLYRIVRGVLEKMGRWIFHDERPLSIAEVRSYLPPNAKVEQDFIIWPILVTQAVIVARKL